MKRTRISLLVFAPFTVAAVAAIAGCAGPMPSPTGGNDMAGAAHSDLAMNHDLATLAGDMAVAATDDAAPADDAAPTDDAALGGDAAMAAGDLAVAVGGDMAVLAGDMAVLPGSCVQIANWPGLKPVAGFDAMNMVTFAASTDVAQAPFNALTIEDWQTMGEKWPKTVTYKSGDKYAACEVCALIQACTNMACTDKYFAQAGTVTVTRADRDANVGRMTATATNLKLVEWDFTQNGDKAVPNGKCFVIGSATFDIPWGASDGGVPADMSVPPKSDMAGAKGDMAVGGCIPVVNEVQTGGITASDEFVEIYNPCQSAIDLSGWKLGYRSSNDNNGGSDITLVSFTQMIPAGGYLVYSGKDFAGPTDGPLKGGLASTGGAVGLIDANGTRVDSVAWQVLKVANAFTEKSPAPNPPAGQSIERLPNGTDTDDNAKDFKVGAAPTPKAANQ